MEQELVVKQRKIDPVGKMVFGEKFKGFMKTEEVIAQIPAFKEFYYQAKIKNPNETLTKILQSFNKEVCDPLNILFHPYMYQLRMWRKKWDLDLLQQMTDKDISISDKRNIHQVIKTRNEENRLVLGGTQDSELEAGVRTLGGELLNDAMQMLRDDQELEEIYDDEVLMKRRSYIVNVFAHATKLVHGKAALMLKASEEKRSTATFLMSILSRATSGKMTEEEMELLKIPYIAKSDNIEIKTL